MPGFWREIELEIIFVLFNLVLGVWFPFIVGDKVWMLQVRSFDLPLFSLSFDVIRGFFVFDLKCRFIIMDFSFLQHKCDLINMSYGEPSLLPDYGRFVELVNEVSIVGLSFSA